MTSPGNMAAANLTVELRAKMYSSEEAVVAQALEQLEAGSSAGLKRNELLTAMEEHIRIHEEDVDDGAEVFAGMIRLLEVQPTVGTAAVSVSPGSNPGGLRLAGFQKDFKLSGMIGDGSNSLSYMSFIRQVEAGRKKGRTDAELVDGIIRSIQPGCQLRGYLEGRDDLSLPVMQRVIRSFYQEKTATELYQELCTLCQNGRETPQDFLFRGLTLRQKILFASKEHAGGRYDARLVEHQFKHALCTGLADDMIRVELQRSVDVYDSDEALIAGLTEIVRRNAEVQAKRGTARVKSLEVAANPVTDDLVEELKALRASVEELQQAVKTPNWSVAESEQRMDPHRGNRRLRNRCPNCQQGNIQRCFHCYRCGSDEHYKAFCPKKCNNVTETH